MDCIVFTCSVLASAMWAMTSFKKVVNFLKSQYITSSSLLEINISSTPWQSKYFLSKMELKLYKIKYCVYLNHTLLLNLTLNTQVIIQNKRLVLSYFGHRPRQIVSRITGKHAFFPTCGFIFKKYLNITCSFIFVKIFSRFVKKRGPQLKIIYLKKMNKLQYKI